MCKWRIFFCQRECHPWQINGLIILRLPQLWTERTQALILISAGTSHWQSVQCVPCHIINQALQLSKELMIQLSKMPIRHVLYFSLLFDQWVWWGINIMSSFSQISSCLKDLVRHLDSRMLCKITKYTVVQLEQLTCILSFGLHSSFYCLNKGFLKNWVNTSTTLHTWFHCLHSNMATTTLVGVVQWIIW